MRPHSRLVVAAILLSVLSACQGRQATPAALPAETDASVPLSTATEAATPTLAALGRPVLEVAKEPVRMWSSADAEVLDLYAGERFDLDGGSRVAAGPDGVAILTWPDVVTAELLSAADVSVAVHDAEGRVVRLSQAAGAARYGMGEESVQFDVSIGAGGVVVAPVSGEGLDSIVAFDDALATPAVWVLAMGAPASVSPVPRDGPASGQSPDPTMVAAGHAVRWSEEDGLSEPVPFEALAAEVWYGDTAAGTLRAPVATIAFRCEVIADGAEIRSAPQVRASSRLGALSKGEWVTALGRDERGEWLSVLGGLPEAEGWLLAENVRCAVPMARLLAPASSVAGAGGSPTPNGTIAALAAARASATPTVEQAAATGGRSEGGRKENVVPTLSPATQEVEPTEDCGTECANQAPPTETPRPPRRTPTQPSQPTDVPPEPTSAPPPEPTSPPPEPTIAPPEPTSPPAPDPSAEPSP